MRIISREAAIRDVIKKWFNGDTGGEGPFAITLLQKIDPTIIRWNYEGSIFTIYYDDESKKVYKFDNLGKAEPI